MVGIESVAEQAVLDARVPELHCRRTRMFLHAITWALAQNIRKVLVIAIQHHAGPIALLAVIVSYVMVGWRDPVRDQLCAHGVASELRPQSVRCRSGVPSALSVCWPIGWRLVLRSLRGRVLGLNEAIPVPRVWVS